MFRQEPLQQAVCWRLLASITVLVLLVDSRKPNPQLHVASLLADGSEISFPGGFRYYNLTRRLSAGMALKVQFSRNVTDFIGLFLDSLTFPAPPADLPKFGRHYTMYVASPSIDGKMYMCELAWRGHSALSGFGVEITPTGQWTIVFDNWPDERRPCTMSADADIQRFALPANLHVMEASLHVDGGKIALEPEPAEGQYPVAAGGEMPARPTKLLRDSEPTLTQKPRTFTTTLRHTTATTPGHAIATRCAVALLLMMGALFLLKCIVARFGAEEDGDGQPDEPADWDAACTSLISEVNGNVSILSPAVGRQVRL